MQNYHPGERFSHPSGNKSFECEISGPFMRARTHSCIPYCQNGVGRGQYVVIQQIRPTDGVGWGLVIGDISIVQGAAQPSNQGCKKV